MTLLVDEIFQGGEVETKELGSVPLVWGRKIPKDCWFFENGHGFMRILEAILRGPRELIFAQFIGFPDLHFSVFWDGWIFGGVPDLGFLMQIFF